MSLQTIHELVREAENNYLYGSTQMSEHVSWNMHDTIEKIDAYINSKHTSGETDSLGRDKPFFNIVTAATNIWYRATDIDRKDIRIMPSKTEDTLMAFVASVHLQEWMRRERFGVFLNQWGRTLAKYGSAICKFVEQDGRLIPSVVPWSRFIADPVQFDALPRIEKLYFTPAQLRKNKLYDQEVVDRLVSMKAPRETLDGHQKDNLDDFIEVYEVHGELDSRLLQDDPDFTMDDKDINYVQQMHVVAFISGKESSDFTLYRGRERKDPYMITHLIEEDGRTLAIGAVEHLFNAQWMVNHSMKNIKDTLDIASKLIFQTADTNFVGRNVLNAIETGDIFVHRANMPLTRLSNDKPDIAAFQNFSSMWQNLGAEITSTPDAIKGNTLPSGTPFALGSYLGEQANSLFEIMTENKGLTIEDMLREYVIPHLKKQMDTKEELMAALEPEMLQEIDAIYVPRQAVKQFNERAINEMFKGIDAFLAGQEQQPLQPFNQQQEEQSVQQGLSQLGNKRSFTPDDIGEKTWKEALKDFEWRVQVEVTNESVNKQAVLATLSAALQTIASNPQVLADPNAKMLFGAILQETGRISPLQLATARTPAPAQPSAPGATEAITNLPEKVA